MGLWRWLNGMAQVQIVSADTAGAINRCFDAGIILYRSMQADEMTLLFWVRRQDVPKLKHCLMPRGDTVTVLQHRGLDQSLIGLKRRPVLMVGISLLIALACFLPSRVLFVQVEGNGSIPDRLILEKAAQCGIYFGAERSAVRSERMKNALLEVMPQLQWAGVNTIGCVAVITVREREPEEKKDLSNQVSSIVAVRDGVIESYTASKGTALCKVGQAVTKGQTLISGYTDCGITIRAEAAAGEVYALTQRELKVSALLSCQNQGSIIASEKKYSLKIGKNRINFYKGSGISDTTCDRIYEENYITLPGGFVLPIAVVTEEWTYYHCTDASSQTQTELLSSFAQDYILGQMVAGKILSASETTATGSQTLSLEGMYHCREMIGRVMKEEIIQPNEND